MKVIRLIQILLMLVLVCSCSKEQTVLSSYRDLKKELKTNSSDYSMEDWERVLKECEMLEEKHDSAISLLKRRKSSINSVVNVLPIL